MEKETLRQALPRQRLRQRQYRVVRGLRGRLRSAEVSKCPQGVPRPLRLVQGRLLERVLHRPQLELRLLRLREEEGAAGRRRRVQAQPEGLQGHLQQVASAHAKHWRCREVGSLQDRDDEVVLRGHLNIYSKERTKPQL